MSKNTYYIIQVHAKMLDTAFERSYSSNAYGYNAHIENGGSKWIDFLKIEGCNGSRWDVKGCLKEYVKTSKIEDDNISFEVLTSYKMSDFKGFSDLCKPLDFYTTENIRVAIHITPTKNFVQALEERGIEKPLEFLNKNRLSWGVIQTLNDAFGDAQDVDNCSFGFNIKEGYIEIVDPFNVLNLSHKYYSVKA